jgi:hypothetical protein
MAMMHTVLAKTSLFQVLQEIDEAVARATRCRRCPCGGPLHVGNYPRKPRGGPAGLPEGYEIRFSFCCGREGCRRRMTPPSVRFMGRRWYVAVAMLVTSALSLAPHARPYLALRRWQEGRPAVRTVERWRTWWRDRFSRTAFWQANRGRFSLPPNPSRLPLALVKHFDDLVDCLRFLSPISTRSWARSLTGDPRR